ncbi:MAG: hypothetical protein WCJ07_05285 [Verrucomicrobiota bacterium]
MNAQEEEIYRQRRVRLAERVKSEAELHKVCLVCTSVSCKTIAICPVCHSYQWDESAAAVTEAVDRAATFVFPFTLGFAPPEHRQPEWPPPPGSTGMERSDA